MPACYRPVAVATLPTKRPLLSFRDCCDVCRTEIRAVNNLDYPEYYAGFTNHRYALVIFLRPRGVRPTNLVRRRGADWKFLIMANNVKRQARGMQRGAQRAVAAGALGAATLSALLLPATPAQAQPVTIPGVGTFEVPDQVQLPAGIPGVPESLPIQIPAIPGIETPGAPLPFAAPQKTAGDLAVEAAMSKVGTPYVYGAAGPNAFDCSGLVQWSYAQAGVSLPRTSYEQANAGTPVSADNLQPGDVVSFYGGGHSGIYIGNGEVVHASTSGQPVKVAPISSMPFSGAVHI